MAENTNPYSYGSTQKPNNDNSRKLLIAAAIVIASLLGVIGFLIVSKNNQRAQSEQDKAGFEQKLSEADQLKLELDKQIQDANLQLEEMKTKNGTMTAEIEKYQSEIKAKAAKISSLISVSNDLKAAREEMNNMRLGFEAKVAALTAQVDQLTTEKNVLTTEKTALQGDLAAEKTARQQVVAAKEAVVAEKTKVEDDNRALTKKVDVASLVKVSDITAVGFTVKDSGKEVKKNFAKNIERLKVCFSLAQNDIIAGGREVFYVRIITPTGETINVASQGGGILTTNKGEQVAYSFTKEVDYNNDAMNVCMPWDPGQPLKKGNYEVEVYNKTMLAGKGTFTLK